MRSVEELKTAVTSLGLSEFQVSECSMCGYPLKWLFRGDGIYYDSGCYCVDYGPSIRPRTWEDLADFYNRQTAAKIITDMDAVFGFNSLTTTTQEEEESVGLVRSTCHLCL